MPRLPELLCVAELLSVTVLLGLAVLSSVVPRGLAVLRSLAVLLGLAVGLIRRRLLLGVVRRKCLRGLIPLRIRLRIVIRLGRVLIRLRRICLGGVSAVGVVLGFGVRPTVVLGRLG